MFLRHAPLLLLVSAFGLGSLAAPADGAGAATRPSGEIRRGIEMGAPPAERARRFMERTVARIEPSLHGEAAKLPVYLAFFKREFVQDPRTFAFDVAGEVGSDGVVRLTGYAEYPEHREALDDFLRFLGFDKLDDRIQALPAKDLGDRPFALVSVPHAFLYDRPAKPRETVSQALLGDPLFLLMERDGHYLCHSAEGYIGYVAKGDVRRVAAAAFSASQSLPRATFTAATTAGGVTIPAGAHLRLVRTSPAEVTVRLPGGAEATVPASAVTVTDEPAALAHVAPVIAAARRFMGTKYVWGGKSLDGIDCSGLVQTAFQTQSVRLPRDADQQGYVGQLVATRWHRTDLRPGDTLYFLSRTGRVHHTAIYVGDRQFIEAAGPGVRITSFDPAAPNYDERRDRTFCFAKRILD